MWVEGGGGLGVVEGGREGGEGGLILPLWI